MRRRGAGEMMAWVDDEPWPEPAVVPDDEPWPEPAVVPDGVACCR